MCEKGLAEVMIEPQLITDNIKQGSHTYNSNQHLTFNVYWICLKINRFKKNIYVVIRLSHKIRLMCFVYLVNVNIRDLL